MSSTETTGAGGPAAAPAAAASDVWDGAVLVERKGRKYPDWRYYIDFE
jgi:hypothetical protein